MPYSVNEYVYSGGDPLFPVNFALGYLKKSDVAAFVRGEVDGLGGQVYRTFTWVGDSNIRLDSAPAVGSRVVVRRTVSKTDLPIDTATSDVTRASIAQAFKHQMMAFHEVSDGRTDLMLVMQQAVDAAAAQAGIATTRASQAASSATAAGNYAAQANAAAVAAGAPIFTDTSAGLAGTSHGDIFFTPQSGGLRVWTNSGGVAAHTGYIGATGVINPLEFGALGNNDTNTGADDGAALQAAFSALVSAVNASAFGSATVILDLQGRSYKTTVPLGVCNISGFSWQVRNGTIWGHCTGKAVIDASGSRGGCWSNVTIRGDATNTPSVGWQASRVNSGFYGANQNIDRDLFIKMHLAGHFSVTSHYALGQESATYLQCSFWNEHIIGRASIHAGYPLVVFNSEFIAPLVSATSNIHNRYIGCDFLSLPTGRLARIATISQSNPAVVDTITPHPFVDGDEVNLSQVSGMDEANSRYGIVQNATATSFELLGVDTSALPAATPNLGIAVKSQQGPTLQIGRISSTRYIGCYSVNYGAESIRYDFPTSSPGMSVELDFLFEGAPKYHLNMVNNLAGQGAVYGLTLTTQSSIASIGVIASTGTSSAIHLPHVKIAVHRNLYYAVPLFINASEFSMADGDVYVPTAAQFNPQLVNGFTGKYAAADTPSPYYRSIRLDLEAVGTGDPGVPGAIYRDPVTNTLKISV